MKDKKEEYVALDASLTAYQRMRLFERLLNDEDVYKVINDYLSLTLPQYLTLKGMIDYDVFKDDVRNYRIGIEFFKIRWNPEKDCFVDDAEKDAEISQRARDKGLHPRKDELL